jgi:hypothetical protein
MHTSSSGSGRISCIVPGWHLCDVFIVVSSEDKVASYYVSAVAPLLELCMDLGRRYRATPGDHINTTHFFAPARA